MIQPVEEKGNLTHCVQSIARLDIKPSHDSQANTIMPNPTLKICIIHINRRKSILAISLKHSHALLESLTWSYPDELDGRDVLFFPIGSFDEGDFIERADLHMMDLRAGLAAKLLLPSVVFTNNSGITLIPLKVKDLYISQNWVSQTLIVSKSCLLEVGEAQPTKRSKRFSNLQKS